MPAKKPKTRLKPSTLPGAPQLLKQSLTGLKQHPKLIAIVAVILIPTTLLNLAGGSADGSAFGSIAALLMNLALIWAVIQIGRKRPFTVKEAYFQGTAAFVRFAVVALALVLMLMPLVIALSIAGLGVLPPQALVIERLLLGGLALLIAVPSVYWLARYVFGLFIICEQDLGPIAAIKKSGSLVRGRWLTVAGRLAVIAAIMMIVGSLSLIITSFARASASQAGPVTLQLVSGLIGLPYLNLYLYKLYAALNGQTASR